MQHLPFMCLLQLPEGMCAWQRMEQDVGVCSPHLVKTDITEGVGTLADATLGQE